MTEERQPHRTRLWQEIGRILLEEWDPIGVADAPEAHDEYDAYVGRIYEMLIRQEPKEHLFGFLWRVETADMGLVGDRANTLRIADHLCQLGEGNATDAGA